MFCSNLTTSGDVEVYSLTSP